MPTYQYACTNPECGERFELVQAFTDPSATECPVCGSPVRKVFSAVGVVFKGSGFYRNDSREANGKGGESKDRSNKESTSSGSDSKSENKTDAKSEKKSGGDSGSSGSSGSSSGSSSPSGAGDSGGKSAGKAATPA